MNDRYLAKFAALLVVVALTAFGCGEDDNNNTNGGLSNGPSSNDNGTSNGGGDADAGDAGSDADSDEDADSGDADEEGAPEEEGNHCGEPTDLGELAVGEEHTFESTLLERATDLDTSCERDEAGETARVFSFEPEEDARLSIWSTVSPSQYDLREGGCDEPEEVLTCSTTGRANADVKAGETYHLVVWGDSTQSDFDVRLTLEEVICDPDEEPWCQEGEIYECRSSTSVESDVCADDCADETTCRAEACDSAFDVDLSSSSEQVVSGNLGAYQDDWNAADLDDGECAYPDTDSNPDTPEADTFFEVVGLTAGETLVVESLLSGDYSFFVLETCSETSCLTAIDDDDLGDQRLSFDVPDDGDYIVVIEPKTGSDRDFEFAFERQ